MDLLALLELKDHLVSQDSKERLETTENLDHPDPQVFPVNPVYLELKEVTVDLEHLDQKVSKETKETLGFLGHLDHLVSMENTEIEVHLDQREKRESLVTKGKLDHEARLELKDLRVILEHQASPELLVNKALLASRENLAVPGKMARKETEVFKAIRVHLDSLDSKDHLEKWEVPERQANKEMLGRQASKETLGHSDRLVCREHLETRVLLGQKDQRD